MKRLALDRAGLARWEVAWTALVLAVLVVIVSLAAWPSLIQQGRDSTIFAYFGFAVTEGAVPYRDVWDNKPPLVFAINALAFWLLGPDRVAIWIITTINTFLVCWVFFMLTRSLTGDRTWAWLGTVSLALLVRHPGLAADGNYTETYALLPHLVMLLAGWSFLRRPRTGPAVAVGAGAALAALGRPTFIGAALILWPAILLARDPLLRARQGWRWLAAMAAGGVGAVAIILIILTAWGGLRDALDAMLLFNLQVYAGRSLVERIIGGLEGRAVLIVLGPLLPLALGAAGVLSWQAWRGASSAGAGRTMRLWLASGLIADLLLANVSGQGYSHYYLVVLPQFVLLLVLGLRELMGGRAQFAATSYVALMVAGVFINSTVFMYVSQGKSLRDAAIIQPVAVYVTEQTAPGDYVYTWARSGEINFQSRRLSPAQYSFAWNADKEWDGRRKIVEKVIADLYARPPALVVDMGVLDGLAPLSGSPDRAVWQPIYDYVAGHCVLAERIFYELVPIYHCNGFEPRETS